ncbi:hypothetical protein QTJ16_005563 [Diplocarpon rosae]|uniref:Dystroglycan-type cadherin-like domain-containing protein n=1 Tax=Diplocarpon rosae TaxID=946125 RepID=A0AAD9SYD0_9HELO|nr:hypothetical protein QTJ16_005563 [Diplocarpon rosae]
MTYALSSGPSWLSLDSNTRTLSGTPSTSDTSSDTLTSVPISLTASDADGSITMNASLVISKDPAPSISIPATQLQSAGRFSAPSTLLYYPSTPFTFNLEPGTFTKNGRSDSFSYYAVTTDNTPMPAWIQFDGSTLEFSGQTPDYSSLILPPQTFGLQLIASDVQGFGGSSMFFEIEVGVHLLAFKNADVVINATTGDSIDFNMLSENLELDGNTPKLSDLVSTSAQIPSWMTFNNATLSLTGTVPADATSTNVTIETTDIYGDTADVIVRVIVSTELFSKSVQDLNATIGSNFSYDLGTYLTNRSDTSLAVQISPAQTWLSFNPETFNLVGQVPSEIEPTAIDIELSATSNLHKTAELESFKLLLVASNDTTTSSSGSSSSMPKKTPTVAEPGAPTVSAASSHKPLSTRTILAISIPLGIAFLTLLLAFCFYCYRRRAARKQRGFGKIEKRSISSPIEAASSRPSVSEDMYQPSPLLPVPPPRPLQLDMSGFTTQGGSRPGAVLGPIAGAETAERGRNPTRVVENPLRRSKTMSDPRLSQMLGSYDSDISRRRSKSANELSRSDNSWRYTQDSSIYPNQRSSGTSSSQTQHLTRSYSNYSRKGHVRRSAMIFPLNTSRPNRESYPRQRPKSTILNLRDSNFSETPLDSFSALQSQANIQEETDAAEDTEAPILLKSTRRQSKLTRMVDRPISIGHGRPQTTEFISGIAKRRSIGHGKDQAGVLESKRDSRTWLTVATLLENEKRRSIASASSTTYDESRRKARPMTPRKTIRQVTKSPSIHHNTALSESSGNSRLSRPVSRRVGSSPFFGGSSIRNSNSKGTTKTTRQFRASYADSPTVPEEAIMISLEATIARGLREMSDETEPRDSFGISYGMAKEGTRQLRSFLSSQLRRSRTRDSLVSTGSRDSRFESAASLSQTDRSPHHEERPQDEIEYEDYLPDGFSDGSWETQRSARDEADGQVQRNDTAGPGYGTSKSTPSSPELGRGARIVQGAGRRPVSSDAEGLRRVGTQRGEMDYTAYI